MTAKLSIGVDPDIRCINMAVLDGRTPVALFVRRNIGGTGDKAIIGAAKCICQMRDDFIRFISTEYGGLPCSGLTLTIESQNMQQAVAYRGKGRKVDYQDILHTGQLAGIWLGAFGSFGGCAANLVQPSVWKGQVPKTIHHGRIYSKLRVSYPLDSLGTTPSGYPFFTRYSELSKYSYDKINPGDFVDINDSLGLALWGLEK